MELAALATMVCRVLLARAASRLVRAQERHVFWMIIAVVHDSAASLVNMAHRGVARTKYGRTHSRERGKAEKHSSRTHSWPSMVDTGKVSLARECVLQYSYEYM